MRIGKADIACTKELGDLIVGERARLLYDEENQLFAIEGDDNAPFAIDKEMFRIKTRRIPTEIKRGRYEAWYDEEKNMIVADLRKPIPIS